MTGPAAASEPGVVELRAGVIHLHWDSGPVVTEDGAHEVMSRVSALCCGRRRPLLVPTRWLEALGYRGRNVFAAKWPLTRVAVTGTSSVDQVIFVFYVARYEPVCPTQFFTSEVDAVKWLKSPARAAEKAPVPGLGLGGFGG